MRERDREGNKRKQKKSEPSGGTKPEEGMLATYLERLVIQHEVQRAPPAERGGHRPHVVPQRRVPAVRPLVGAQEV